MAVDINSRWMTAADASAWHWFDAHLSHRGQGDSLGIFAYIGNPVHVAIAGLVSGSLLSLQARSVMRLVVVTGAVGAGAAIEQTIKALTDRSPENLSQMLDASTPEFSDVAVYAHTFPSGHVTGAATLLGMIAVCVGTGRSCVVRTVISIAAVIGILAVAALTLYVRAHTFTDVIGGLFLGGALVALGAAIIVSPSRSHAVRRPAFQSRRDSPDHDQAARP